MRTLFVGLLALASMFTFGLIGNAFAEFDYAQSNQNVFPAPCEGNVYETFTKGAFGAQINLWSYNNEGKPIQTRVYFEVFDNPDPSSLNKEEAKKSLDERLQKLKKAGVCL